jgi:hypothetical protein
MPKVTIHRPSGDFTVEDITFEQAKELVGVNGYGSHAPAQQSAGGEAALPSLKPITLRPSTEPNFSGFLNGISERGKKFIEALREYPDGLEADLLAALLDFNDARQIGGLTGGGIAKIAKRYNVKILDIYRSEATFPGGKRLVMFYPGKAVLAMEKEKPAV